MINTKILYHKNVHKTKKTNYNTLSKLLKKQTGGASNTKLLFLRDVFKTTFDLIYKNLDVYKSSSNKTFTNKINTIDNYLSSKLDKLLTLNDKKTEVDLSFINEVYSFPYLDVAGLFAIKKTRVSGTLLPQYEFIKNDNLIYDIEKTLSYGTGAGDILLLKKKSELLHLNDYKDYPNELVLKIYNKKPIKVEYKQKSYNTYIRNEPKADFINNYGYTDYKSYSSLKIFDISQKQSSSIQDNYYKISFDTFLNNNKAFDLNEHNCLIENLNIEKLHSL